MSLVTCLLTGQVSLFSVSLSKDAAPSTSQHLIQSPVIAAVSIFSPRVSPHMSLHPLYPSLLHTSLRLLNPHQQAGSSSRLLVAFYAASFYTFCLHRNNKKKSSDIPGVGLVLGECYLSVLCLVKKVHAISIHTLYIVHSQALATPPSPHSSGCDQSTACLPCPYQHHPLDRSEAALS